MAGRRRRSIINTAASLLSEMFVILVGMFFPMVLISRYGSPTNGLITSLQQFAQYFTLISTSLLGAVIYALYSPLAENRKSEVEETVASAGRLFTRMGIWYTVALAVFGAIYPFLAADTPYSYPQVFIMFMAIGLNGASQLFYSGKYKALLNASQHNGAAVAVNAVFTVIFSGAMIVFALVGVDAVTAVVFSSLAYIGRAAAYGAVARRFFPDYDFRFRGSERRFAMQREVMIQQALSLVVMNIPMIAMTVTGTDMAEISVFSVYNMVITAIFIVANAVNTGVSAGFGDLITRNEPERLRTVYREYEMLYQMFWTVASGCMLAMFMPFIRLYSAGVTDAEYVRPALCILFSVLGALWMIWMQLSTIVSAAGRYRETQGHCIVETVIAVVCSFVGLRYFGVAGAVAGRVISALYRVIVLITYCTRHIIGGELGYTCLQILGSGAIAAAVGLGAWKLQAVWYVDSAAEWVAMAALAAAVLFAATLIFEYIFNREMLRRCISGFLKR